MSKATPRPWNADIHDNIFGNGVCVASTWKTNDRPSKANAELIVRAVNCHDELVEFVEEFLADTQSKIEVVYEDTYIQALKDILKRARGEL